MVRSLSLLTTALVLLSAASAGAQEDFARNGPYLSVSGLFGRPRFDRDVRDSLNEQLAAIGYAVDTEMKGSFGIGGVVGYRLHRFVSAEVEGEWLFAFEGDVALTETGPGGKLPLDQDFIPEIAETEFEVATVTANLKAHLFTGPWQPYLLVGGGMMSVKGEVSDTGKMYEIGYEGDPPEAYRIYPDWIGLNGSDRASDFTLRFGGGLDFYSFGTDSVVITAGADYVLPFGDVEDFDYVSINVGVLYRF